ncbi:rhodanese-like domain-containing protein [Thiospirillum jenense]|uniref:Rhodanese-like domain-containing protein n=1 Tax=Thiospirillum jenense TaxID=1653858 RepID=A0A839HDK7_9GAMM|nr:rhodanese-like domain-containing protein [Thiospirillum jenense]MBB1125338.1 rhodanese-like domain-containing protein [Thiospirillum jenense]
MNQLPQPLTPHQAYQMLGEHPQAVLIDIRSTMEYLFVGHPCGCVHIPWIDEPDWVVNPEFVTLVRKVLLGGAQCALDTNCAPVILICRSGKRSLAAGTALLNEGFTQVFHVSEGFEGELDSEHHRSTSGGWRYHGLPWEQC